MTSSSSSRVLITGGAGFIGSSLAAKLHADGAHVTVLDTLSPQIHGQAPETDSPLVRAVSQVADLVVGSVTDTAIVEDLVARNDVVVHLAAETGTGQSMYDIRRYVDVNSGGTANLLQAIAGEGSSVRRVVVASSRAIYGEGRYASDELGFVYPAARREEDLVAGRFEPTVPGESGRLRLVPTTEDSAIHPTSVYGITKQNQEALIMVAAPSTGVEAVALRYQNVYGPGQSLRNPYTGILSIFSTLIRSGEQVNIFEDGLESRDFVYIDDVVEATARAISAPVSGEVFNVGSGVSTNVLEVVEALQHNYDMDVPVHVSGDFRLGDIRHNLADVSKAERMLGFVPRVSFAEGVANFAAWVREQPETPSEYAGSLAELRTRGLLKSGE